MLPHLIPPYSPQPLARRSGPGGAVWFPRWLPATVLPLFTFFDFPYLFYPQGASDGVEGFLYLPVVFLFNIENLCWDDQSSIQRKNKDKIRTNNTSGVTGVS